MKPDASGWKLVLGYIAWLFASIAIALILGLLVGSIASLVGIDGQSTAHQRVVEVAGIIIFLLLAAAPFILRFRGQRANPDVKA